MAAMFPVFPHSRKMDRGASRSFAPRLCVLAVLCIWPLGCVPDQDGADGPVTPDMGTSCHYDPAPAPTARPPSPPGAGPVRAGVGESPIDLPVGTPLGGYSARLTLLGGQGPDNRPGAPFAHAFAPSGGVQTRPQVRALFLQAGDEPLLMVKLDLCVSYDRLVYDLEAALSKKGLLGDRARGHVIVSASHTHSGPGTYQGVFHLYLGFDQFQEGQYQRLLASLVSASKQAIAAAVPARIGLGVWEGWDSKDEIFSDRRGEDHVLKDITGMTGPHKDQRLMVMRVDDAARHPMAVLFNFPMHGTISDSDNPFISVDSTGHVELALEERFALPVLAMHLQGPAGDASPRGKDGLANCDSKKVQCTDFARMESVGELAAPRIYDLWQKIETTDTLDMEAVTRAVSDGRDIKVRGGALSYAPYQESAIVDGSPQAIYKNYSGHPESDALFSPITQFNVPVGAGLCGSKKGQLPVSGIEGTQGIAPYGSCAEIGAAINLVAGFLKSPPPALPECETTRTTLTAVRLSGMPVLRRQSGGSEASAQEDVQFLTLPGEPLSLLAEKLRQRAPFGKDRTFVLGYSQGHIGYILEPENWLLGGYEPSINIYGPLEGEWLMERSLELAQLAATKEHEDAEAGTDRLHFDPGPLVAVTPALSAHAGTVPDALPPKDPNQPADGPLSPFTRVRGEVLQPQPSATLPRGSGRATFVFYGGAPAEDLPEVTLLREGIAGDWTPALHRSGRPVSNRGREILLTYTPIPLTAPPEKVQDHMWSVEWQAVGWDQDDTTSGLQGALRAPAGRYRFAVLGHAGGKEYRLQSRPFQVTVTDALKVEAQRSGGTLSGRAYFPVGNGYRLLRLAGPSNGDVPATGVLSLQIVAGGTTKEVTAMVDADGKFTAAPAGIDLTQGATLTVADAAGNSGSVHVN